MVRGFRPKTAEQVLELHGTGILRLAYSYLHNREDAEDVLQETLIQYLRKAPAFNDEQHEKAWFLRVAANISKKSLWERTLPTMIQL